MAEGEVTGVRVYVLTVDSETNAVLKTEEEDPNTGHRTEVEGNFQVAPAEVSLQHAIPAGFVPSVIILVGAPVSAAPQIVHGAQTVKGLTAIIAPPPTPHPPPPPPRTTVVPPPRYPVPPKPPPPKPPPPPPKKASGEEPPKV